jgi:hypothetical protein
MTPDEVRASVLAAVEAGRLPRGGPSHLAALDLIDEMPGSHWREYGDAAAQRIRARAARPPCRCAPAFAEPGPSGRCSRCQGFVS